MTTSHLTRNGWDLHREGGGGMIYVTHGPERQFVARFKYANPGKSATAFIKFLTEHFTPAEYFAAVEKAKAECADWWKSGREGRMPDGDVLRAKGFVPYNLRHLGSTPAEVDAAIARAAKEAA